MKHMKKVLKEAKDTCEHEVTPIAAFVVDEENLKEAYLLQVCEFCGQHFLLMGSYPLTVY